MRPSYPLAEAKNDTPDFGRLIAEKECDSYGYDTMLRVNLNWLNEGVSGDTDLCARLAQFQQLSGYEESADGQWIILQKGRLRVTAADSPYSGCNALDQVDHHNNTRRSKKSLKLKNALYWQG